MTHGPEPIDFSEPTAVSLRKAADGALWAALRRSGWTDEQIHNGLNTYRQTIAHELADKQRAHTRHAVDRIRREYGVPYAHVWEHARNCMANSIDPEVNG